MGQQNSNPMDLVEQINEETSLYAETTSEGKIAVKDANGVVQYEISNGEKLNYRVVYTNGSNGSFNYNADIVKYINKNN